MVDFLVLFQCPSKIHSESYSSVLWAQDSQLCIAWQVEEAGKLVSSRH